MIIVSAMLASNPVVLTVCCPVNSGRRDSQVCMNVCVSVSVRGRDRVSNWGKTSRVWAKEGLTWNCHCIEITSLSHSLYLCSVCFLTWKKWIKVLLHVCLFFMCNYRCKILNVLMSVLCNKCYILWHFVKRTCCIFSKYGDKYQYIKVFIQVLNFRTHLRHLIFQC